MSAETSSSEMLKPYSSSIIVSAVTTAMESNSAMAPISGLEAVSALARSPRCRASRMILFRLSTVLMMRSLARFGCRARSRPGRVRTAAIGFDDAAGARYVDQAEVIRHVQQPRLRRSPAGQVARKRKRVEQQLQQHQPRVQRRTLDEQHVDHQYSDEEHRHQPA